MTSDKNRTAPASGPANRPMPPAGPVALSVVILTLNEEANIRRCIESVTGIADEIVVVDSFSTDRTEAICRQFNVRFIQHRFEGFIEQKNWAIDQARCDHVLSLEGDEALSPALHQSIKAAKANWTHDAFYFNRLSRYCGQWIRHSGWYPDQKLRLWNKRIGRFGGRNPHDRFILNEGATKRFLKGDLLHYAFSSISEHMALANRYSDIKAANLYASGKQGSWGNVLVNPAWKFMRDYFFKLGLLDGFYGLVICAIGAQANFLKYVKLMEKKRRRAPTGRN
jgi:glycosyltransferase involved in cell wall biosynthesis